jgi:flavin-dependent dehydrogenase
VRRTAVLIVGGGPAGAAAAICLARAGLAPEIIERTDRSHSKVCGGFLSADTLTMLSRLAIDVEALGARPIREVRLVSGSQHATVPLPFAAAGLSRRALDAALLDAAAASGAKICRGLNARMAYPPSLVVRTRDDELIQCEALFVATGKHELRGTARAGVSRSAPSVGLRAELPPQRARNEALDGFVELHLFDDGYAGLLLQEDESCNLCLSVSPTRMSRAGNARALLSSILTEAPLLAERIGEETPDRWQAIAGVPYGWSTDETPRGVFRLGDQSGVIASLAGDGLGLALASGSSAAIALLHEGVAAAPAWQRRFRRSIRRPLGLSELLRAAAGRPLPRRAIMALASTFPRIGSLAAAATRVSPR